VRWVDVGLDVVGGGRREWMRNTVYLRSSDMLEVLCRRHGIAIV